MPSRGHWLQALAACVAALCNTPEAIRARLGLSLCVPQTVMVTAMPPSAAYKEHLDSNGRDNPRLITSIVSVTKLPVPVGGLGVRPAVVRARVSRCGFRSVAMIYSPVSSTARSFEFPKRSSSSTVTWSSSTEPVHAAAST